MDRLKQEFEGKVEFRIYNVDTPGGEAGALADKLGVQYVPTFFFVKTDGSIANRFVGEMPEASLRSRIQALL